ncbi:MAG: citrate/2-methylcitrate synthase [Lachnospiraceae bacterium]|jgi:citrate synthase|nr:citrate/2-methylcitrate synthase [Lachnospiraceae bacterium]MDD3616137.1 citrate/2-methylcitrate synthase [Lachnospiraceae bacterium]
MSTEEILEIKKTHNQEFKELLQYCLASGRIDQNLYQEYDVKRGLRDSNGKGVLTGLTEISDVVAYKYEDGRKIPADGTLYFQGYNVADMISHYEHKRQGFEETIYTLIFGRVPNARQFEMFKKILNDMMNLSNRFIRDVVMKASNENIMNAMQRCVLTLYTYDENPDGISVENALRQSLQLIAKMPLIAVYSYHSYRHFRQDANLMIKSPKPELSFSENILYMLREDGQFTELEAKVLDIALVLHAEHGGGNNSTFTTHVVTSSGTDTYSAVAASIGSLKGPKHGGANLKVQDMFEDIENNCPDWENEEVLKDYLDAILDKKVFDHAGLIYGMGHAVYTLSDPREVILKRYAKHLAAEKGMDKEFELHETVEKVAGELIMKKRKLFKPVCANVDFYSGFVYSMLGIPRELYTPIFAISRMAGWSAHRMEELVNAGKIIRPAYRYVGHHRPYLEVEEREEENPFTEEYQKKYKLDTLKNV